MMIRDYQMEFWSLSTVSTRDFIILPESVSSSTNPLWRVDTYDDDQKKNM